MSKITQMEIAKDVGHLTANDVEPLSERCAEIGRLLGGLIKARGRFGPKRLMFFFSLAVGAAFAFTLL